MADENDIFYDIQVELEKSEDEIKKEHDKEHYKEDDFGFGIVLKERQAKKDALRERLKNYYLTDEELDRLFKIIEKAEEKMESIKKSVNYKTCKLGEVTKMSERIIEVQNLMKEEFDSELSKLLKKKYEDAKKILKERQIDIDLDDDRTSETQEEYSEEYQEDYQENYQEYYQQEYAEGEYTEGEYSEEYPDSEEYSENSAENEERYE